MGTILDNHSNRDCKMLVELKADLKHLERKAIRLIDETVMVQDAIMKTKWRIKTMGSYPLPDGRTR